MAPASGRARRLRRAASGGLALLVFAALGLPQRSLGADLSGTPQGAEVVPGELVVGFDESTSPTDQRQTVNRAGGRIAESVDLIDSAVVVTKGGRTTDEVAQELSQSTAVDFVEPNYVLKASRLPSDAAFGRLWGLYNTGQLGGKPGADINAPSAWDVATDSDVTVAVVDTGIDYRHPDLDGNIWTNSRETVDGRDDDENGYVDDVRGYDFVSGDSDPSDDSSHGTHVAGIVGAEGNNVLGTVGVDWKVHLMPLKFLNADGEGNTADAAEAIEYAIDNGAKVINASWGGPAFSAALFQAVKEAGDRGVLFVAAAGNDGVNADVSPDYPAAFDLPNVISVAASGPDDGLLDFSNYGRRSVDLAAPGDEIYSTVPSRSGGYASYSGTSMAAPFVSGAAALYLSHYPGSSVQQVRNGLLTTVDPLPSLAGKTTTGGRLDLARALGAGPTTPQPHQSSPPPPARDLSAPSAFRLLTPRNYYLSSRRALRFRWQRSHDGSGIRCYKLYVDGKKRKTVRDPDGPGGRNPRTKTLFKLRRGRHSWSVRAYDYAGNYRTGTTTTHTARSTRSVLFVGKRHS